MKKVTITTEKWQPTKHKWEIHADSFEKYFYDKVTNKYYPHNYAKAQEILNEYNSQELFDEYLHFTGR